MIRGIRMHAQSLALLLILTNAVLAVIAGAFLPIRWHAPLMALGVSGLILGMGLIVLIRNNEQSGRAMGEARRIRTELAQIRETVDSTYAGIALIESRAHIDEKRLRQIGQLAKQAAESSREILSQPAGAKSTGFSLVERRPEASVLKSSTQKSHGRQAAAVAKDASRSRKLAQAMNFSASEQDGRTWVVDVIGTNDLHKYFDRSGYQVRPIIPGIQAHIDDRQPTSLVVEERAFQVGPWTGVHTAQGTALVEEMRSLFMQYREARIPIYYIWNSRLNDIYSRHIQELTDYSFPSKEIDEAWADGVSFGLMGSIQVYSEMNMENL